MGFGRAFKRAVATVTKPVTTVTNAVGLTDTNAAQREAAQRQAAEAAALAAALKAQEEARIAEEARLAEERRLAAEAEAARVAEEKRLSDIAAGRTAIEDNFGQFNDPYYQGIEDSFTNFQMDDLNAKYGKALGTLISELSRTGQLRGATRNRGIDALKQSYDSNKGLISDAASQLSSDQRARVGAAQEALYSSNEATPGSGITSSAARAQELMASTPNQFTKLANILIDPNNFANVAGTKASGGGSAAPALFSQERSARSGGYVV
jgi:hypothetical protein